MSLNFPSYGGGFAGHHQPPHQQPLKPPADFNGTPSMLTEMTSKYVDEAHEMGLSELAQQQQAAQQQQQQQVYLEQHGRPYEEPHEKGRGAQPAAWQSLVTTGGVADYLARLPIGLHHFLKLSSDGQRADVAPPPLGHQPGNKKRSHKAKAQVKQVHHQQSQQHQVPQGQQYRPPKPNKPKMGSPEIRLTTALDGSTLFCCPECQLAYPEKELLDRHIHTHKLDRKFVCDICGACLKRKDHLTRHKQSHTPCRPYVCSICMKAFKRKEHLNLHFIMHSGEKTHVCPDCGKGFYCKDHLDRHKQGHNPDRPFICNVCMKGFKRNEHLARHSIIHSGEKSQVCPECGKAFYRKDHLRKHLRSHVAKRVKTEHSPSPPNSQHTVAQLAAMVSMGSGLQATGLEGTTLSLLSAPV